MHFLGRAAVLWELALAEDNVVSKGKMLETLRLSVPLPVGNGRLRVGVGSRNRHGERVRQGCGQTEGGETGC